MKRLLRERRAEKEEGVKREIKYEDLIEMEKMQAGNMGRVSANGKKIGRPKGSGKKRKGVVGGRKDSQSGSHQKKGKIVF